MNNFSRQVCSTLVPLEFYPFTERTKKCLFLNGTPYSRLSRFSVQPAFSAMPVLIYNTINRGIFYIIRGEDLQCNV